MTVTLIVLVLMMAAFVTWLVSHTVNVSPWVAESGDTGASHLPEGATAPRIGLGVFLAVVASVFALTISAYLMRMEHAHDWRPLPEPWLLWVNTGVLVLGSVFFQWAWNAAKRDAATVLRRTLALGGLCTAAFIGGQYLVWQQLVAAGYYAGANPANAFFYMMTALHALHLAGGLIAWARTMRQLYKGTTPARVRSSLELCAVYWHFLLLVWIVLFALVLNT